MKFAISGAFNDPRELPALALEADACGYDSFWMPEAWERLRLNL